MACSTARWARCTFRAFGRVSRNPRARLTEMNRRSRVSRAALVVMITTASVLAAQGAPNRLTAAEKSAGWRLLFDGKTFAGWRGLGYDSVPTAHWAIVSGSIKKIASGDIPRMPDGQPAVGGDLMTKEAY